MASERSDPEVGPRRKAREAALQVLYGVDSVPETADVDIERSLVHFWNHFEAPATARAYCDEIVRGVSQHRTAIDEILRNASPNWRLERMARVDRNVLRIAVWELTHANGVPTNVVIDEAVELARAYGAEGAYAFVNGILDRIARARGRLGAV